MNMPLNRTSVLLAVLASVGLGAAAVSFTPTQAADAVKAPASSVAVVQIRRVMQQIKMFAAMQETQKNAGMAVEKELKARKDSLAAMKAQMDLLDPKDPKWQALDAKFTEEAIQLEGWVKFQKERLGRSDAAALLVLYKQACAAAADVAERKGYDILLAETLTMEQLAKEIRLEDTNHVVNGDREVLWARKSVDLTDEVIAKMNNDFNQRGTAAPAAPAGIAAPPAGTAAPAAPAAPVAPKP